MLLRQPLRLFSAGMKAELEAEIANNKIVVYSKSSCPFCKQTKDVLKMLETKPVPVIHELNEMSDGAERQ